MRNAYIKGDLYLIRFEITFMPSEEGLQFALPPKKADKGTIRQKAVETILKHAPRNLWDEDIEISWYNEDGFARGMSFTLDDNDKEASDEEASRD